MRMKRIAEQISMRTDSEMDPKIKILQDNVNKNLISWTDKLPANSRNEELVADSIHEIESLLIAFRKIIDGLHLCPEETQRIEMALDVLFAEQGCALRKDVKLYPIHPLAVAYSLVTDLGCAEPDIIIAALLHDLIEEVPQFNANPQLLEEKFGRRVRHIVEGLTNKEMDAEIKNQYERILREKLSLSPEALNAVMTNIEYYLGVEAEIRKDGAIRLVKSYDFGNNALQLSNLSGKPEVQARLANKYVYLISLFQEGFVELRQQASTYKVTAEGIEQLSLKYGAGVTEVNDYAQNWQYYEVQKAAMEILGLLSNTVPPEHS